MPSQTIPAAAPFVNNKALLSGRQSIHGQGQQRNSAQDNRPDTGEEIDPAASEQASAENKTRKESTRKADGEEGQTPFEKLFDLVSPEANGKHSPSQEMSADQGAGKAGTEAGKQSDFTSVQQLLAEAGFGETVACDTSDMLPGNGGTLADASSGADLLQQLAGQNGTSATASAQQGQMQADGRQTALSQQAAMNAAQEAAQDKNIFKTLAQQPEQIQLGSAEQLARSAGSGGANAADMNNLAAYRLDSRATSAFDKLVPIVKEAMLTPTQQAQRDGFTVLKQETHFAPVDMLETAGAAAGPLGTGTANSVLKQIGDAISNSLNGQSASNPESSLDAQLGGNLRLHRSGDALRVLDIQLHPADLGKVRLSVRLNDNNVEVRIEATKAATAQMLENNQQELNKLLQKAGYHADRISIVAIDEKGASQILPPSASDNLSQQNGQDKSAFSGSGNGSEAGSGGQQQSGPHDDGAPFSLDSHDEYVEGSGHEASVSSQPYRGLTL